MMDKKTLLVYGLVFAVIQAVLNLGVFVTFPQMTAYAASKESIMQIEEQLNRIESKIDKIMGF